MFKRILLDTKDLNPRSKRSHVVPHLSGDRPNGPLASGLTG